MKRLLFTIALFLTAHLLHAQISTLYATGFYASYGLAFDASGNLYVVNDDGNSVSKIDATSQAVTTFATGFKSPFGLAFDASGNLYVANSSSSGNSISKVNAGGTVTTYATGFNGPAGLAFDATGNLYVANFTGSNVSKVDAGSKTVTTYATGFYEPKGLAFDAAGYLYVASTSFGSVYKVDVSNGNIVAAYKGLNYPIGLTFDNAGNLYIANNHGYSIAMVPAGSPDGTAATTFISNLSYMPNFIAYHDNALYVSDGSAKVYKITGGILAPTHYYVNPNATGFNTGTSWANAYTNLQTAINNTPGGDSIFVARATYQPASNSSFSMKEGVKIFGGFLGTETAFSQRNLANKATLKGNGASVIHNSDLTAATVLDGFSITGGNTNYGGGMFNASSSPSVINCIFSGNSASGFGGGMYNNNSSPRVINCTFSGNSASGFGGGMFNINSMPVITNCTFSGNDNGIYNYYSSPTITNSIIWSNTNGLYDDAGSSSLVTYSDVQGGVLNGTGNISADPLFVSSTDLSLQSTSPCINTGTPDTTGLNLDNTDIVGNARITDAVIDMGAYEFVPPVPPASLNFDGVNDYVQIPNSVSAAQALTIEYWMKTTQTGLSGTQWYQGNGLVDAEIPNVVNDFGTSLIDTKVVFGIGNPDKTIFSTSDVNTGNWVHVAAVWNGAAGTMNLYINGILEASATSGVSTANRNAPSTITLGAINTLINYYNGNIDGLHIWNTARTQSDIQNDMKGVSAPATGLVASYSFSDGVPNADNTAVTTIVDSSGNGYNGTLYNFALTGTTSNFTDGYEYNDGLPVTLISFAGTLQNRTAQLQWSTGVETNFNHFEVEKEDSRLRGNDGDSFATVETINAKGNNSHYTFNTPQPEPAAYYRLKMVDNDGKVSYSNIVELSQNSAGNIILYPNPAKDYINIKVPNAGSVSIYDASGKLVKTQTLQSGVNRVDVSALSAGVYYGITGNNKLKFIKE